MSKKTIYLLVFFFILFSFGISSCSNNQAIKNDTTKTEKDLEGTNKKTINYLLYNISHPKIITFSFTKNIDNLGITNVELLQDESPITSKISIINVAQNNISIKLQQFLPQFNKIRITLKSGKKMKLYVGQYYLEKMKYLPNTSENVMSIENAKIENLVNGFSGIYYFKCKNSSNISAVVPKKLKEIAFSDTSSLQKDKNGNYAYKYSAEISNNYFKENNFTVITFEFALFQTYSSDTSKKFFIFQGNIPLEYNTHK